jgi:hypothetical protein
MIAYAEPDTRGTNGRVRGEVVFIDTNEIFDEADLTAYRGNLGGKMVFTQPKRKLELNFSPDAVRLSDEELSEMARLDIARVAEGALNDGDAKLVVIHGEIGCGWVTQ